MLEAVLLEAGTVLRSERDAWSTASCVRQSTNGNPPPPPRRPPRCVREQHAHRHSDHILSLHDSLGFNTPFFNESVHGDESRWTSFLFLFSCFCCVWCTVKLFSVRSVPSVFSAAMSHAGLLFLVSFFSCFVVMHG